MKFWTTFPRKIGTPFKIVCKTPEEFAHNYNQLNGNVDKLYVGLYGCAEDGSNDEVTLDVVALDIDWAQKYESMKEVHAKLLALNWKHMVSFSTNGYWIYIDCEPKKYPKNIAKGKLATMQEEIISGTSSTFGKPKEAAIDISVRGDVERLTRMPGSFDATRDRFAIFLSEDDIQKGMEHIVNVSTTCNKERRYEIIEFGEIVGLDPDKFVGKTITQQYVEIPEYECREYNLPIDVSDTHKQMFNIIPKPMHCWVTDPDKATWVARAYITLFLREKGFTKATIESFLKPFYEKMPRDDKWKNNWNHYKNSARTSECMFNRRDLKFPNWETLYKEGLIDGIEKGVNPKSSPTYR